MEVTIKGEQKYIPVSTVTLQPDKPGVTYPFHCTVCGNTHSVIGGKVSKISPILEPTEQITVISPCKSCKTKYTFQDDLNGDSAEVIKVILNPLQEKRAFFCYLGGGANKDLNKILEYEQGQIYSFLGNQIMKSPFYAHCVNQSCDAVYQFTQMS